MKVLEKLKPYLKLQTLYYYFFKKYADYYPELSKTSSEIQFTKAISQAINLVIDKFGEIKDSSSSELSVIRRQLKGIHGRINKSFMS